MQKTTQLVLDTIIELGNPTSEEIAVHAGLFTGTVVKKLKILRRHNFIEYKNGKNTVTNPNYDPIKVKIKEK